jgi:hypothetical protein
VTLRTTTAAALAFFFALLIGCSDPGPGAPDSGDAWHCTVRTGQCPSCSTVYYSKGAPGTTPADLCAGTCPAEFWSKLQDCAFGTCSAACGKPPTLVPGYVWDPGCEACLSQKCDSAGCKNDK